MMINNKRLRLLWVLLMLALGQGVRAQVPRMFTYQAVVRDAQGALMANQGVGVRISIEGNDGDVYYREHHEVMTNSNGLFTLLIGNGTAEVGRMEDVDWAGGLRFIRSEIDVEGGGDYMTIGVQQLVSVPYALHAATADRLASDSAGTSRTDTVYYYVYDTVYRYTVDTVFSHTNYYLNDTVRQVVYDTVNRVFRDTVFSHSADTLSRYYYDTVFNRTYDTVFTHQVDSVVSRTYDTVFSHLLDTVIRYYYDTVYNRTYDTVYTHEIAASTHTYDTIERVYYDTVYNRTYDTVFTHQADTLSRYYYDTVYNRTYDTVYTHEIAASTHTYDTIERVYYDTVYNRTYDTVFSHQLDTVSRYYYDTVYNRTYDTVFSHSADTLSRYYYDTVYNRTYDTVYTHEIAASTHTYDTIERVYYDTVYNRTYDTVFTHQADTLSRYYYDTVYNRTYDTVFSHSADTLSRYYYDTVYNRTYDTVYTHEIAASTHTYDTIERVYYDTVFSHINYYTHDTVVVHEYDTLSQVYRDTVFNRTYDTVFTHQMDTVYNRTYDTVFSHQMDTVYNRTYDTVYSYQRDTVRQVVYDTVNRIFRDTVYHVTHDTVYSVLHDTVFSVRYDTVYAMGGGVDSHYVDSVVMAQGQLRDSLLLVLLNRIDSLTNVISTFHPTGEPEIPDGPNPPDNPDDTPGLLPGSFSIAAGQTVRFAKGNLQYRASDGDWRFAEHQYDYLGTANNQISATNSNYIDLFGWGTSGWNSGAVCYMPYSHSTTITDYFPGGSNVNNLTGNYANADWGVNNAISNGDNSAGEWRTLSRVEWNYLLYSRTDAASKRAMATIAIGTTEYYGMIFLPDDWTLPDGCTFSSSGSNLYSETQWAAMEEAGALFLPAGGARNGTTTFYSNTRVQYWTSTAASNSAYSLRNGDGLILELPPFGRHYGLSVRLVKDE